MHGRANKFRAQGSCRAKKASAPVAVKRFVRLEEKDGSKKNPTNVQPSFAQSDTPDGSSRVGFIYSFGLTRIATRNLDPVEKKQGLTRKIKVREKQEW